MRKAYIQDERIVLQRRKVGSDAFGILFYGLLASVLAQQFILCTFSQYAAELILLLQHLSMWQLEYCCWQ